jgi:hypothetical protein
MCSGHTSKVEKQVAAAIHNRCCKPSRVVSSCVDLDFNLSRTARIHERVTLRTSRSRLYARLEIFGSLVEAKRRLQRRARNR